MPSSTLASLSSLAGRTPESLFTISRQSFFQKLSTGEWAVAECLLPRLPLSAHSLAGRPSTCLPSPVSPPSQSTSPGKGEFLNAFFHACLSQLTRWPDARVLVYHLPSILLPEAQHRGRGRLLQLSPLSAHPLARRPGPCLPSPVLPSSRGTSLGKGETAHALASLS